MVYVVLAVIGLCLGSFVNALVWRIKAQQDLADKVEQGKKLTKADQAHSERLSISKGRSMCMSCGHELAAKDLIPVVSWLWLRGKCRYCKHAIPDTPVAELLVPLTWVLSYLWWPFWLHGALSWLAFGLWLGVLVLFVALALYDLRWYLLPNRLVLPLTVVAALYVVVQTIELGSVSRVAGGIAGAVLLSGIFYGLFMLSSGRWIGGGDVKMAVALGLLVLGPLHALLVLFVASLGGIIASLPGMFKRKVTMTSRIPFGPFLLLGTFVVVLFGSRMISWYLGQLVGF